MGQAPTNPEPTPQAEHSWECSNAASSAQHAFSQIVCPGTNHIDEAEEAQHTQVLGGRGPITTYIHIQDMTGDAILQPIATSGPVTVRAMRDHVAKAWGFPLWKLPNMAFLHGSTKLVNSEYIGGGDVEEVELIYLWSPSRRSVLAHKTDQEVDNLFREYCATVASAS